MQPINAQVPGAHRSFRRKQRATVTAAGFSARPPKPKFYAISLRDVGNIGALLARLQAVATLKAQLGQILFESTSPNTLLRFIKVQNIFKSAKP